MFARLVVPAGLQVPSNIQLQKQTIERLCASDVIFDHLAKEAKKNPDKTNYQDLVAERVVLCAPTLSIRSIDAYLRFREKGERVW